VIDYERCIHCRQCLNFCLFAVYAPAENGAVRVHQPMQCKNHCPACARICPRAAIIFPKHGNGPINGDVNFSDHDPARARQDPYIARRIQQAGPHLLDQLRQRSASSAVPHSPEQPTPSAPEMPPA
jgi:ferredoxin